MRDPETARNLVLAGQCATAFVLHEQWRQAEQGGGDLLDHFDELAEECVGPDVLDALITLARLYVRDHVQDFEHQLAADPAFTPAAKGEAGAEAPLVSPAFSRETGSGDAA